MQNETGRTKGLGADGDIPGAPAAWPEKGALVPFESWVLLLKAARKVRGFGGRFQANETHPHQLLTLRRGAAGFGCGKHFSVRGPQETNCPDHKQLGEFQQKLRLVGQAGPSLGIALIDSRVNRKGKRLPMALSVARRRR